MANSVHGCNDSCCIRQSRATGNESQVEQNEIKTLGIVLSRKLEGEADRRAVVLTPDFGKLQVRARGAARAKSRHGALLEPLCELEMRLVRQREGQETWTLASATLLDARPKLKASLPRTAFAMLLVETVEACCPFHAPHPAIYSILTASLGRLLSTRNLWGWALACQLEILAPLGLFPRLSACASCGGPVAGDCLPLSPQLGGVVCRKCGAGETFPVLLPRTILQLLAEKSVGEELELTPEEGETVESFLRAYLEYHLEWRFRSLDFIAALKRG